MMFVCLFDIQYNECITYDDEVDGVKRYCYDNVKVTTPHCINDIIEEKSGKCIDCVYLGHHNTKIILIDESMYC